MKARIEEILTECFTLRDYEANEFDGVFDQYGI